MERYVSRGDKVSAARPKPAPIPWDSYADGIDRAWQSLLSSPSVSELNVQEFLEEHPSLVPYASEDSGDLERGPHGSLHGGVIARPRLPGRPSYVADLLRITRDSGTVYAHLIEIESPTKPLFRKNGQPRAPYTQAQSQLGDWKTWFADPQNLQSFWSYYRIPSDWLGRRFSVSLTLIYGRRDEVERSPRGRDLRTQLLPSGFEVMTFDRLRPQYEGRNDLTLRMSSRGPTALHIEPTLELSTSLASVLAGVSDKPAAIRRNRMLTPGRQAWLIDRFASIEAWLAGDGLHILSGVEVD